MRFNSKILLLFILSLFLLSFATLTTASSVVISPLNATSNHVYFDESAHYSVTVTNTQGVDQVFSLSINPVDWVTETPTSVMIGAGETKTFPLQLRARPSNYKGPGFYIIPVTASSPTNTFNKQVTIYIKSVHDGYYKPSVALSSVIASSVDPRQPVAVQVDLRNRNILNIENMDLSIESDVFKGTFKVNLGGLEEKTLEYRFDIDPLTPPHTSNLTLRLTYQGDQINEVNKFFDIAPYSAIDRNAEPEDHFLFKYTRTSTLQNIANVDKTVSLDLDFKWYERPFTSVDIRASEVNKTGKSSWDVTLGPQETGTVTVVQNYRIIPIIILLIIIGTILYFTLRSPIVLRKQTIVTGKDLGGVSEMKVRVYILNRTGRAFYNVRVLDKVPSIAHVKVGTGLGVLEPSDVIKTEKRGTVIKWDFDTIESFEERVVTYTIKAKLNVMGPLSLPPVRAKFESAKGKQRTTTSGKTEIGNLS